MLSWSSRGAGSRNAISNEGASKGHRGDNVGIA